MDINLHNYEAYFLDYHEGNLSLDLIKELMEFLSHHPELREEFESFEPVTIQDTEEITFWEKDTLKKKGNAGIDSANFDEVAIEYVEGTLSADKQKTLKAFIAQNPHYARELELYTKTKIVADNTIVFEDKASLKRGIRRPVTWYYWSAAASVAIIVGAYFILNRNTTPVTNTIAQQIVSKDSNTVASSPVKAIDTTNSRNGAAIPSIPKIVHNHIIAVRTEHNKNNTKNKNVAPQAPVKDSAIIAAGKTPDNNQQEPVKKLSPAPPLPENNLPVAHNPISDTSAKQPLIVMKDEQPEVKKKKSNFLAMLKLKGWCVIRDINQI